VAVVSDEGIAAVVDAEPACRVSVALEADVGSAGG
jgi:hypothetical protein